MEQNAQRKRIEKTKKRLEAIGEAERQIRNRCLQLQKVREIHKLTKDAELPLEIVDEIKQLETEIRGRISNYKSQMKKSVALIDSLVVIRGNGKKNVLLTEICHTVLYRRYILCEKWEAIAVNMGYNLRYIYKVHGVAVESLANKGVKRNSKDNDANKAGTINE